MSEDLIGSIVNQRYRLTRWIHSSATGDVFEATDQKLFGQRVALKILNQNLPGDMALFSYLRRRFEEEARISIQLGGHPHIAQVKDFDVEGDRPFLVMELLGAPPLMGRHLGELLESTGPLTLDRFLKLAQQSCSALHYAHCFTGEVNGTSIHGVIHRDIKPANLYIVQDPVLGESVKVLDFGIAKLISDVAINMGTNLFGFVGTPSHASPEQLQGKALDRRTDIYSLGVVFYQMLTGQLPIQAETDTFPGWYEAHNFQIPRSLQEFDLSWPIPAPLDTVILSCLAKHPEQRPKTMQLLSHQLDRSLRPHPGSIPASAPRPIPSPSISPPPTPSTALSETVPSRSLPTPTPTPTAAPIPPTTPSPAPSRSSSRSRREFVRPNPRPIIPTVGKEGRYRIESHLGSGGMGEVYLALDTHLNRQVAVKIMTGNASEDARTLMKRFKREADVCASLNSPHIVQVTDFGTTEHEGGYPFFVMEYLQGETLGQLLTHQKQLPLDRALRIAAQVCSGLSEAHHQGIVHRDLKPDNIFLIPGTLWDLVKVLDFGVAKVMNQGAENATKLTVVGAFLGTLCYSSPEQCIAQGDVDHSTDIYSLGLILYEMLSGTNPFKLEVTTARDNFLWIDAHVHTDPIPLQQQPDCDRLPKVITQAVMRCLQKKPRERFSSIDDLLTILQSTLQNRDLIGAVQKPAPAPTQPTRRSSSLPTETASPVEKFTATQVPQPIDRLDETIVEEHPSTAANDQDQTVVETPLHLLLSNETVVEHPQADPTPSITDETVVEHLQVDLATSETVVEQRDLNTRETIVENHHPAPTPRQSSPVEPTGVPQPTPRPAPSIRRSSPAEPPRYPQINPDDRDPFGININIDPEPTGSITRPIFDREQFFPRAPAPAPDETPTELGGVRVPLDEEEDWDDDDDDHEEPALIPWQDPAHRNQHIEDEISQINPILNPTPAVSQTPSKSPPRPNLLWRNVLILLILVTSGIVIYWGVSRTIEEQQDPQPSESVPGVLN